MIFYVLGNGFDLHYKLPTQYCDFKQYLIRNGYGELVRKVDRLFWEKGGFNPKEIKEWSVFEDMLIVFNHLFSDELYEEAFADAEVDDDRAGFWDSPAWNVRYYNEYVDILKQQFDKWIREMDTKISPDKYFQPAPGDAVLSFNYTTTIEDNFDTEGIQITHIHGTKNQDIVLGHNDEPDPDLFENIIEDEDSDYRDVTTKRAVNEVLSQASQKYYKNSAQILRKHHHIFEQIPRFDKVVIMGLSCGLQDELYVRSIVDYASDIDFYYYKEEDKENFMRILGDDDITVNFHKW